MNLYLVIALGSALGGVCRFGAAELASRHLGWASHWGILAVNVIGCFAIGFIATLTEPEGRVPLDGAKRHFFMTGVLGGFTTFSTFSFHTVSLFRNGDLFTAGVNVAGSVTACLIAAWLGHLSAAALVHSK